ncbi:hypothetical protein [Ottowia sp.]|uniref:hypothetical protein n=1 Tax=Ottowia sp. TaxID=1898956 RepID=UPI002600DA6D|nr:hypothetical protein [Ottowia sp.]MBK6616347.1 hypothetical protein [Ottowia sp.]
MLNITALFREMLAAGEESSGAQAVRRYLTIPLTDEVAEGLESVFFDGLSDSELEMRIEDAFMYGGDNRTLEAVLDSRDGWEFGTQDADYLDVNTVVGARCLALMVRTDFLMSEMPDLRPETAALMREAAKAQCATWIFG